MITPISRKRATRAFAALAMLLGMLAFAQPAGAVHDDGVFELEGNADDDAVVGDDWENILNEDSSADSTTGIQLDGAPDDADGRGVTIFTGGGSKDQQDTASWKCKNGSVPDKDELIHGFAARYTEDIDSDRVPAGDLDDETILYFGADRYDNSGDAQIGFWFLQDDVGCTPAGGGGTSFTGNHTDGDVLILSDFTQGGTQPTISIFTWVGSGGSHGSLDLLAGGIVSPATCGNADDDDFCAVVNSGDNVDAPWDYLNKSGDTRFDHGEMYEGGVNLSAEVFGDLADECFASFVVETRSSQSVTATLKDFVAEQFEDCTVGIATTPDEEDSITLGETNFDHATVTGTGGGTPTGTVTFFVCGPDELDTDGLCSDDPTDPDDGGTQVGVPAALTGVDETTATADSDTVTPDAVGTWCFRATYNPDAASQYDSSTDFSENECFEVTQLSSSVATAQNWLPNDTATVTSAGTVAGTVDFVLYDSGDCTGTVLYSVDDRPVSALGVASTNNTTTYVETASNTVSWRATFTSSDSGVAGSTGECEVTVLTITNDPTP